MKSNSFEIHRKENLHLMLNASSNYDKAILVLSAAAIGVLPHFDNINKLANCHCFFVTSIWFFFLSIVASLISFFLTEIYAVEQTKYDIEVYIKNNSDLEGKIPVSGYLAALFQILAGIFFVIALLFFVLLANRNCFLS